MISPPTRETLSTAPYLRSGYRKLNSSQLLLTKLTSSRSSAWKRIVDIECAAAKKRMPKTRTLREETDEDDDDDDDEVIFVREEFVLARGNGASEADDVHKRFDQFLVDTGRRALEAKGYDISFLPKEN